MKNTANDEAASDGGFGPEAGHLAGRIACLAEFMTADRYAVLRRTVAGRTRYMTVLAENMFHGQNAAALVRHCEAFGIQEMHTVESLCPFEPSAAVVRGDRPVGGHPAASFDGRRAGGAPRRGLPHRRHDAPPRGLHPRDVRRRAGGPLRWSSARSTPGFRTGSSPRRTSSCVFRCAGWSRV